MRSYDPNSASDCEDLASLNAEPWQIELLAMNPEYPHWGPYEDYMAVRGAMEPPDELGRKGEGGWNARALPDSWSAFGPWGLDSYNEVVHFYFELNRESRECETCEGSGYHPDARWVSESFYQHSTPFRGRTARDDAASLVMAGFSGKLPRHLKPSSPNEATLARYGAAFRTFCEEMECGDGAWDNKITTDELEALMSADRLHNFQGLGRTPTVAEVNAAQRGPGIGHDAINRGILIEARCKRFGIPLFCPTCAGDGSVFTAPAATVSLILWVLHPRKGCSRGVEVKNLLQEELPEVFRYLRAAAKRNAERFSRIPEE